MRRRRRKKRNAKKKTGKKKRKTDDDDSFYEERLCEAAEDGRIVRCLKDPTIDVNRLVGKHGYAALHCACEGGHYDIVKLLLDHGANIELQCFLFFQYTPLIVACRANSSSSCEYSRFAVVKELLNRGANVHVQTVFGLSPLHCACQNGHYSIADVLLDHGADTNLKTVDGETPPL